MSLLSKTSIFHLLCVLGYFYTHYTSNVFQYLVFVFEQVLKKIGFPFKRWSLKHTSFIWCLNFYASKIVQIVCNMCWFLITHIYTSKCLYEIIFVDFIEILWDLKGFSKDGFWAAGGRPTGRPTCTRNVHKPFALARSTDWSTLARPDRPSGRPTSSPNSRLGAGRLNGRRTERFPFYGLGMVDWVVDRQPQWL